MEIARGITEHTIVLCVDKRERAIALQALLVKKGFKVVAAVSIYDALKSIAQEMPHLVITDSLLSDGTAGTLYDRLLQHPTLKTTPILVLIPKKTVEHLTPLTGRKFAGFLLGQLDGRILLNKVSEVLAAHADLSPYFFDVERSTIDKDCTISFAATVMGRSGERVVSKSNAEVDANAALICVPTNKKLSPVLLKMASNLVQGEDIFNLFPLSRVRGKGREWLETLPEIHVGEGAAAKPTMRSVLFFDPNQERFEQFKEVLAGYNINLIHAGSVQAAVAMLIRDASQLGCAYLHELTAAGVAWKEAYVKLPPSERPPVIVGTTSLNMRSTPEMRYIRKPFGLGALLELMEASFERASSVASAVADGHENANVEVTYQAPARLIGLDETGGIFQLKFPVVAGSQFRIEHPALSQVWDGQTTVQITGAAALQGKPDIWHAKFVAISAGGNKAKYWDRMFKYLATTEKDEEATKPAA